MSRELKFRAWDAEMREMLTSQVCFSVDDGELSAGYNAGHSHPTTAAGDWVECEVMQYTGLKDANGVEIYEGDIALVLHSDWPSQDKNDNRTLEEYKYAISNLVIIAYRDTSFVGIMEDKWGDERKCELYVGHHGQIKVIGNIHQNPELLRCAL